MLLFFSLQTHPMHKAFVTVATGQCLGVFGCCSTNIVPGGACVLCNLSLIELMTKLSSGTGYNYVGTKSCVVNHLPCLSHISLSWSMTWEFAGVGEFKKERGRCRKRQIFQRTSGPFGHACQLGCVNFCLHLHVLYFEVEGGGWSQPLECTTALISPPQKQQHGHIVRNNIFNSLSQSEHFMSCNETFWQLPPWPCALCPQGVMA